VRHRMWGIVNKNTAVAATLGVCGGLAVAVLSGQTERSTIKWGETVEQIVGLPAPDGQALRLWRVRSAYDGPTEIRTVVHYLGDVPNGAIAYATKSHCNDTSVGWQVEELMRLPKSADGEGNKRSR